MPVEIINLISSPDVSHPAAPSRTEALPPTRPNKPHARVLNYDIFDLTDEVSHNASGVPRRTRAASASPPAQRPSAHSPPSRRRNDIPLFSSDDDLTFDVFDDAQPAHKKPRLESPSTGDGGALSSRILQTRPDNLLGQTRSIRNETGPGVLQPARAGRWQVNIDPIQTSSDPFASSPFAKVDRDRAREARDEEKENVATIADDHLPLLLDDDPFASSPRLAEVEGKGKQAAALGLPGKRHVHVPSSPIFVSSQPLGMDTVSPTRGRDAKGKGKSNGKTVEWDHISSSAPEAGTRDEWDLNLDLDDRQPRKTFSRSRSEVEDFDLGDLLSGSDDEDGFLDNIGGTRPSRPSSSSYARFTNKVTKRSSKEKDPPVKKPSAEKDLDRLDKAAAKEAEKRRKQREKEEAKEQRQREKERAAALAEVNKVRTDKKVSTPEMIVDLPSSLDPNMKVQVEALLEDLRVTSHSYTSPVKNVVKWRRKVRARFHEGEGHWEPIPERVEDEKHAMVILNAPQFVELALGVNGSDLEAHILEMQRHYRHHTIIYLIEGLTLWMRKNRNARNRQFQSAVRSAGSGGGGDDAEIPSTPLAAEPAPAPAQTNKRQRKKKDPKPPPQYIDEDALEDALLQLQVHHGVLIHHTAAAVETAHWVAIFTQHISTIPYRRQRDAVNASAAFCMDSGQVRTGDGARDTYARMLQEIARVTAPIAWGIAAEFGSVSELVRGLERQGPLALEGIRKSANKDGAYTDRMVGQAVSRRVYKVFMGRDETSTDI